MSKASFTILIKTLEWGNQENKQDTILEYNMILEHITQTWHSANVKLLFGLNTYIGLA